MGVVNKIGRIRTWTVGAAVMVGILTLGVSGAQAGLTVTPTTLDDPSSSGTGSCPNDPCSLREAVNYVYGQGGGTVSLAAPAPQGSYDLALGTLDVRGRVSIVGPGPDQVTIDLTQVANATHVIDKHPPQSGTDTISGVTITGGKGGIGGGILDEGGLALSDVIVTGNTGVAGGGIAAEGSLTISNSTISGNTATSSGNPEPGGGIWIESSGPVSISDTTIADNTAGRGGGIYQRSANPITLQNVTLANNHATIGPNGTGGNIYSDSVLTNQVHVFKTIIAGGTASVAGSENCGGVMPAIAGGTNDLEDRNECGLTGGGDIVNANPLLGPLQNNGGMTSTFALGVGSPAINRGANCLDVASQPLSHDQRGVSRPQGPRCDMGAFEFRLPRMGGAPRIAGTAVVGHLLTCQRPTIASPDGTPRLSYLWLRDGASIGASGRTHTVRAADADHALSCRVTARYAATLQGGSVSATSAKVKVPPHNTKPPVISGQPVKGHTLRTTTGSWSDQAGLSFKYRWERCSRTGGHCSPITAANHSSYKLTQADVQHKITVVVTATDRARRSTAAIAKPVGPVAV